VGLLSDWRTSVSFVISEPIDAEVFRRFRLRSTADSISMRRNRSCERRLRSAFERLSAYRDAATMSLPGIFTPVNTGSMVLVDGGVLDEIPVEAV
jgi:predicted acylesterase/phospholipase RssA